MTGIERRQFAMLVRVRNFGQSHVALFASSPVAQEIFATLVTTIDELTTTDGQKLAASVSARGDRTAATRRALVDVLSKAHRLAKTLRADGQTMARFELPRSRSDVSLVSAGRQFALDAGPFEAEFSGHGMAPALIAAMTAAFEAALSERGVSRGEHVAARARIRGLLAAALRGVQRLDLLIGNTLGHDAVVQARWTQLRRLEEARLTRGGAQPSEAVSEDGPALTAADAATNPEFRPV